MNDHSPCVHAHFSTMHYVNSEFHSEHQQLIHCHKQDLELLYILSGSGNYTVAGRQWHVKRGNLIICRTGVMHGETPYTVNQMRSLCCVSNQISFDGFTMDQFIRYSEDPILHFTEDRSAFEHLLLALNDFAAKKEVYQDTCDRLCEVILQIVIEKLKNRHSTDAQLGDQKIDAFILAVTRWLDEHYMEEINLPKLGNKFHVSHYYLGHLFKQQTGYSPIQYVTQLKIGEAQKQLMNSDLPIGKIAEMLGFNDTSHFNTMFKKYIGISPSKFRQYSITSRLQTGEVNLEDNTDSNTTKQKELSS